MLPATHRKPRPGRKHPLAHSHPRNIFCPGELVVPNFVRSTNEWGCSRGGYFFPSWDRPVSRSVRGAKKAIRGRHHWPWGAPTLTVRVHVVRHLAHLRFLRGKQARLASQTAAYIICNPDIDASQKGNFGEKLRQLGMAGNVRRGPYRVIPKQSRARHSRSHTEHGRTYPSVAK